MGTGVSRDECVKRTVTHPIFLPLLSSSFNLSDMGMAAMLEHDEVVSKLFGSKNLSLFF